MAMLAEYTERTGAGGGKLLRAIAVMDQDVSSDGKRPMEDADKGKLLAIIKADLTATERMRALRSIPI